MLTKGNFTRDEWNYLLCLSNISHFSSAECSEVMSKRTQKESGEERVTAKSRPMMNLVARCSERTPAALSSTASESLGKTRHESQTPLSPQTEKYDRTVRPVVCAHSSSYPEWNVDKTWFTASGPIRYWKRWDEFLHRSRIRIVVRIQIILAQGEWSSAKEAKQYSKDATKDSDEHSVIWGMFVSSTLRASVFMGKNYSDNWHSIKNTEYLAMKQMFDISEKLVSEQSDEIYGVKTINWVFSAQKSTYSQILCYAVERWVRTHYQILSGKTDWRGSKVHHNTELWTELMVSQWNSSGTSSQDSHHCSSATKSKSYC